MKFYQLLPLILSLFIFSCERKRNVDMITFASQNLENHEADVQKIVNYLNNNIEVESLTLDIKSNKDSVLTYSFPLKKNEIKIDEEFKNFLLGFYDRFGVYRVCKDKSDLFFCSNIRNEKWDSYRYIWLKTPNKPNPHYKYYSNNEIPKEISGWRYKLQNNWYLESLPKH